MANIINLDPCQESELTPVINGQTFKNMFSFAVDWFARSESDVNALNVFPVPDGDTGTNMLLTMHSSLEETLLLDSANETSVSAMCGAMAHGSLMGARGNSGVILCQIWRGIAESLKGKEILKGIDLAEAFQKAAQTAYEGIENPVEGTMLTVMKEIAAATSKYRDCESDSVKAVLQTAVEAAGKAVANTPNLLPVLKEAGVVDSGGQGLYILFEGALMYLNGQTAELQMGKSKIFSVGERTDYTKLADLREEVPYGYCTEFLLKGQNLDPENIRQRLKKWGESLIVTGDESTVRIHIHCPDPSPVIHDALSLGAISAVCIRNMDEQNSDLLKTQKESKTLADTVVVAVTSGQGFDELFNNLGVSAIVPGGQTMNPSTKQILQAVEAVPSDRVIILPNDKNLVLVAQQVGTLTDKTVGVVPTTSIPQGIAALLAFNPKADLQANLDSMLESKSMVQTIEVTRAIRSTRVNGFSIRKGQAIGLLDGKLLAVSDGMNKVINDILEKINLASAETISIYYGADIEKAEAEKIRDLMYQKNNKLNIDITHGGQPLYHYIISLE